MPPADPPTIESLLDSGRFAEARDALLRLARRRPNDPDIAASLTFVLGRTGERDAALFHAERAARLAPGDSNLLTNLGNCLLANASFDQAERSYRAAAAADPRHAAARVGVTHTLFLRHRLADCVREADAFITAFPMEVGLRLNRASALQHLGRACDAVAAFRDALAIAPDDLRALSGLANAVNYCGAVTPAQAFEAHAAYGRALERLGPVRLGAFANDRDPDRPLRIAILSADLRSHACAFFLEPLIRFLPREHAPIFCYMTGANEDAGSARLKALDVVWRNVAILSPQELALAIRADRVDVLIDASGHTAGHRLPALHLGAAPVQATYFGYPNTTGVRAVGWRIVDSITDPGTPEFDALATERLTRLDPCFLCYEPPAGAPSPVAALPCEHRAAAPPFTFGSFNAIAKIDEPCIRAWAEILKRSPGSRLFLKHTGLAQPEARAALAERFINAGADAARLRLEGPAPDASAMLPFYNEVDLALDTFPYNGTTTTCEALFMGVPVVAFPGSVSAARVSASILTAAGLPQLVAPDARAYIELCVGLAADRDRLRAARQDLRDRFLASPVCEAAAFGARFGALVRNMWRDWTSAAAAVGAPVGPGGAS